MNHTKWIELLPQEKVDLTGKLVVAVQMDEECFAEACKLINKAQERGVFEKVRVGHKIHISDGLSV